MDKMTLDQIRVFVAVVDAGSFSAAARKLGRVQSAVSYAVSVLEEQLGLALFERDTRVPVLTSEGKAIAAVARKVLVDVDDVRAIASQLKGGRETDFAVAVDALFPVDALVAYAKGFAHEFPDVALTIRTETLSAVSSLVKDASVHVGVVGPAADARGLEKKHLASVRLVAVVSAKHPLAKIRRAVGTATLRKYVQIVLAERAPKSEAGVPDQGVLSPKTWRVVDLATKHAMLVAGLGFGNMPEPAIQHDLRSGRLVRIRPDAWGDDEHLLSLAAVWLPSTHLGPAARWSIDELGTLCRTQPSSTPRVKH